MKIMKNKKAIITICVVAFCCIYGALLAYAYFTGAYEIVAPQSTANTVNTSSTANTGATNTQTQATTSSPDIIVKGCEDGEHDYGAEKVCSVCGALRSYFFEFEKLSNGTYAISAKSMHVFPTEFKIAENYSGKIITIIQSNGFSPSTNESMKNVEKIVLPETLTSIRSESFDGCEALKEINLPEGITYIGDACFLSCKSLERIVLPNSIREIDDIAFAFCEKLEEIVIPPNIDYIGTQAFWYCSSLNKVEFAKAENGDISNNIYINGGVFMNCISLKSIIIPKGVDIGIGDVFEGCTSLKSVVIESDIRSLREGIFSGCLALETLYIPKTLMFVEENAFLNCKNLKTIYYDGTLEEWGKIDKAGLEGAFSAGCTVICTDGETWA